MRGDKGTPPPHMIKAGADQVRHDLTVNDIDVSHLENGTKNNCTFLQYMDELRDELLEDAAVDSKTMETFQTDDPNGNSLKVGLSQHDASRQPPTALTSSDSVMGTCPCLDLWPTDFVQSLMNGKEETSASGASADEAEDYPQHHVPVDITSIDATPPQYTLIKHNQYVSREQNKFNRDDYICSCQHARNGDDCAKNACLNVLSCYECVSGGCAIEDEAGDALLCKNRRFQRGEWKQVSVRAAGQKGWGLYADQDIECGEFVIEYVDEVIDGKECTRRLASDYLNAEKFYIFQLQGGRNGESIDATIRGGPARFMNHSCDPNCKPQKWTVGAEQCLGLFAVRDIKQGEELTFDYQFKPYGSVKQRCLCGASKCREYLGANHKN